ncbi:MAG: SRPBCC family protein [Saprospiraceae bacterium]|jgi:ligand-binding SRPBCC domain-containing protein|nr:SRPBCC family protein [Saprospiraceae bacterium]
MNVKRKEWVQLIPKDLDEVWHFFSRPENLNDMTPDDMDFHILTDIQGVEMYEGMVIQYKVSPMLGIKLNWVTEITHVRDRQYFIDEQRFGPYALWHHQHHFELVDGGVKMTDILNYKVPYGVIGNIANAVFVENRIEEIFQYRIKAVERIFNFQEV